MSRNPAADPSYLVPMMRDFCDSLIRDSYRVADLAAAVRTTMSQAGEEVSSCKGQGMAAIGTTEELVAQSRESEHRARLLDQSARSATGDLRKLQQKTADIKSRVDRAMDICTKEHNKAKEELKAARAREAKAEKAVERCVAALAKVEAEVAKSHKILDAARERLEKKAAKKRKQEAKNPGSSTIDLSSYEDAVDSAQQRLRSAEAAAAEAKRSLELAREELAEAVEARQKAEERLGECEESLTYARSALEGHREAQRDTDAARNQVKRMNEISEDVGALHDQVSKTAEDAVAVGREIRKLIAECERAHRTASEHASSVSGEADKSIDLSQLGATSIRDGADILEAFDNVRFESAAPHR